MQDYTNSKRQSLKTIGVILLTLVVAYLPVSTFLFFIKNDAFNGYFPPKFFMSESLHAGHLPLWNPYINYGIPQYGDMSSGFWSPVTWLIAATVGYNAYSFTIEVLAYIFIGGMGMYVLTGYFRMKNSVRAIAAVAYMCSGYNVGHLQHFNWLSGAAFLPWCLWSYLLMQRKLNIKNVFSAALLFYLFISSAHPGLTIGGFYFFLAVSIFLFFKNDNQFSPRDKTRFFIAANSLFVVVLLLVSVGLLAGYSDILSSFSRGNKITLADGLKNPTSIQSWISAILPLSPVKNDGLFLTDISMRNVYFSLTLVLFFFTAFSKWNAWQKFLVFTGSAFLLLSSGGIFKTFAYKFIPLIGYVRLDGEFTIFSLLCFILVSAMQLQRFIEEKKPFAKNIARVYYAIEIFLFTAIGFGLYKMIATKEGLVYSFDHIISAPGMALKLKALIDAISFYDALWIQGIIQMLLLWGIKFFLREKQWNKLTGLVIADLIIATLMNLPFTGVGKASVADVQHILNVSPKGIPIPKLQPVSMNDTASTADKGLVGDWSFYNKQIGVAHEAAYPVALKNTKEYFRWMSDQPGTTLVNRDYLFSRSGAIPGITAFNGSAIKFTITSAVEIDSIIYQQAAYKHWFYYRGSEKEPVNQNLFGFISVPVTKGSNTIEIKFEPTNVITAMVISLVALCLVIFLLVWNPAFIRRSLFPS